MDKYFKNYILLGDAENHCLLCNETFQSLSHVEKHIRWENHRKRVKTQSYVPKFKQDLIYKLEKNYYCVICNYSTQDINIITKHINDEFHKINKLNPEKVNKSSIGQYDGGFVLLGNSKKITYSQWHGIIGKKCIVCSTDVNDIAKHVKSQEHVINLIQSPTNCENGEYYRKTNQNSFQCFDCKDVFPEDTFNEHCTSKSHFENLNKIKNKSKEEIKYVSEFEKLIFEAKDILIETQKDFFNMNYADKEATCKTCHKTIDLDLKNMLIHMKKHHTNLIIDENQSDNAIKPARDIKVVDLCVNHGKRRSELACFGRENFIKLSEGARKAYCTLCDVCLSPEIKVFENHLKGAYHSAHLKFINVKGVTHDKEKYKTFTLNKFITNLNYCKQLVGFMINKEYVVNNLSFLFIKKIDYNPRKVMLKCHTCDMVFQPEDLLNHCQTTQHANNVMSAKVIDIKEEFIREIQLRKYHCGFCNQVFPFMETVEKHLKSWQHTFNKNEKKARYCLELYHQINGCIPDIQQITLSSNCEMMYSQFFIYMFHHT